MKYIVLLAILAFLWFLFWGRGRAPTVRRKNERSAPPQQMVACAHCGVHLPRGDALFDAAGQPYCVEAHRLAGPKQGPR